ncbi:hypothetical protein [Thiorhodococcus mannitoliphagus]|uniref:hypothetical protein n=1 Tax=Thiorhodococcus mannitoliphagus TaxID=329406 RepID=UPI00197DA4BF|nr:hypothetical protein [Thiorhodococcus mannitoliphagus]
MSEGDVSESALWPSADYHRQIDRLRAAVGRTIHLLEVEATDTHLSIRHLGKPYILLDVLDFPRPDPARGIAPHLLLLDDGRGVNLGRIARVSLERAFGPSPAQILYQDKEATEGLLFRDRQLTKTRIAERSRQIVGQLLGNPPKTAEGLLVSEEQPMDPDNPQASDH